MNPATYHKGEKFQVSFDMEYEDETNLEIIWKLDGIKLDKVRNKNIVIDMTDKTIDIDTTDIPIGIEHTIGVVIHEIAENESAPEEILAKFKVLEHVKEEIEIKVGYYLSQKAANEHKQDGGVKEYKDGETIILYSESFYSIATKGNIDFKFYKLESKDIKLIQEENRQITELFQTPSSRETEIIAKLKDREIAKFPVNIIPLEPHQLNKPNPELTKIIKDLIKDLGREYDYIRRIISVIGYDEDLKNKQDNIKGLKSLYIYEGDIEKRIKYFIEKVVDAEKEKNIKQTEYKAIMFDIAQLNKDKHRLIDFIDHSEAMLEREYFKDTVDTLSSSLYYFKKRLDIFNEINKIFL